ncbi:cuticle collagen 13-like [Ammospiza caudacuta]|uniref:cuticle collagen 13-like n=1 Tax=Ammospiza caudacuta TaxID=2857398 RepID=UPI0027390CF2|nr:cuticle collagen 13-like [Ammospiza caudacuta]
MGHGRHRGAPGGIGFAQLGPLALPAGAPGTAGCGSCRAPIAHARRGAGARGPTRVLSVLPPTPTAAPQRGAPSPGGAPGPGMSPQGRGHAWGAAGTPRERARRAQPEEAPPPWSSA